MEKLVYAVLSSFQRKASGMVRIANRNFDLLDKAAAGPELLYHVETPGYWACNVARYWKQLGLSSSRPW